MAANRLGPEVRGNTTRPGPIAPSADDTWFVDCAGGDPTTGTAVEQSWFNRIIANLRSIFTQVGMTVANSTGDDNMLRDGVARQTQAGQMSYAVDTGAANAMVVALSPIPLNGYQAGMMLRVKVAAANTGAVTINVNSLGAKAVVFGGNLRAIGAAEFQAGDILNLAYDGTRFQCLTTTQTPHNIANPTLYVRTDGSDAGGTHDGSINDSAHAFLTVQAALNAASNYFNLLGKTLTIQLGIAGTYASFVVSRVPNVNIVGNAGSPASYIIDGSVGAAAPQCCVVTGGSSVTLNGLTFSNPGSNHAVQATGGASIDVRNSVFGGSAGGASVAQICASAGSSIIIGGPLTFNVGSGMLLYVTNASMEVSSINLTIGGAITIGTATVRAENSGALIFDSGVTWSGSTPTGKRYLAGTNGVINTGAAGASFVPGTIAGTVSNGGVYV